MNIHFSELQKYAAIFKSVEEQIEKHELKTGDIEDVKIEVVRSTKYLDYTKEYINVALVNTDPSKSFTFGFVYPVPKQNKETA